MIFLNLLNNIALLVSLSIVHGLIMRRWKQGSMMYQILSGLLFGGVTIVGMMTPLRLLPGIIFDGRSIIISIAGLFGGPITAVISAAIAAGYRVWLGGAGAIMGVSVISESACFGIAYHYLRRRHPEMVRPRHLLGFGLLVHAAMLILTRTLPGSVSTQVFHQICIPVLTIYPTATVLLCMLFLDQESSLAAEMRLREKTEELEQYFTRSLDLLCIADTNGCFRRLNPEWQKSLGYPIDEMVGRPYLDFVHPDDIAPTVQAVANLAEQKQVKNFVNRYRAKDGTYRWIEWRSYPTGNLVYSVARDITERRRTDEELRRLASAVQQAAEIVVITDPAGTIEYVNPAFERITGYTAAEAVGQNPRLLKSGRQCLAFYEDLWKTITGGAAWSGHFINRRKDGTLYHEDATISPIRGENGQIVHFVAVKRDVTREVELEEHLHLAQRLESVGLLAGGVAHDLNNLLAPILGYGSMLLEDKGLADTPRQDIEEMMKAANRARDLVQQLMAFGRKQVLEVKPLNLNDVITGFGNLLRRTLREDIRIELNLVPTLRTVKADRGQLEQVLMNLALNAQDAMPKGGTLTIETVDADLDEQNVASCPELVPGRYVLLTVSDTGIGLDEQTQARIFEPFFTTKKIGKGMGLGLATVYGIVKQHGGNIWVSSKVGQGTTFGIHLPTVEEKVVEESIPTAMTEVVGGDETILVAEDDPTVREMTCTILQNLGYHIISFKTAEECLSNAQDLPKELHLLLTDVVMPEVSGRDLYARLCEIHPGIKVLYMSGYTANVIAHRGVLDEGTQFIQKPFTRELLARKVRQVLES